MARLHAVSARGRLGGRPKKLIDNKERIAVTLLDISKYTIKEISMQLGLSPFTLYHFNSKRKEAGHSIYDALPKAYNGSDLCQL